jgi:DNA-binding NarL/FixJ family response regulator
MEPSTLAPLRHGANRFVLVDGHHPEAHPPDRPAPAIGVLLAHAEPLVRAGLRALLEQQRDIIVTDEAPTGEDAVALASRRRPDVVLIDLRLPGLDGVDAVRRIAAEPGPGHPKVLVLSHSERDEEMLAALRAGASGLLVGDIHPPELVRAVRVVAGGEALLSPSVTRRLIEELVAHPDPGPGRLERFEELTAREREVAMLVAMGMTNEEIAERLVVSRATAKTHVSRAMGKVHAHDRAKLVALAYQAGLVAPRRLGSDTTGSARASVAPPVAA